MFLRLEWCYFSIWRFCSTVVFIVNNNGTGDISLKQSWYTALKKIIFINDRGDLHSLVWTPTHINDFGTIKKTPCCLIKESWYSHFGNTLITTSLHLDDSLLTSGPQFDNRLRMTVWPPISMMIARQQLDMIVYSLQRRTCMLLSPLQYFFLKQIQLVHMTA